jgi:hypothetical protein
VRNPLQARVGAARTRLILERDFRSFRRRFGTIVGPTPSPTRGIALLASLSYSTYQVKLEGMFAKAFQLQGLEPVVATLPDAAFAGRYLETFGVRRFVTLEDYLDEEREREARREGEALLARVSDPADLRKLRFHARHSPQRRCSTT